MGRGRATEESRVKARRCKESLYLRDAGIKLLGYVWVGTGEFEYRRGPGGFVSS